MAPLLLTGGASPTTTPARTAAIVGTFTSSQVLVLPTAAAYLHPERQLVELAEALGPFDLELEGLMVLSHADAQHADLAASVAAARTIWLTSGNALHLRSVLAHSAVLDALVSAYATGATIVAEGAAASAIVEPMVDPRGGALTLGLGLELGLAVVVHDGSDPEGARLTRTVQMAPPEVLVVDLAPDAGIAVRDGAVTAAIGDGVVRCYRGGHLVEEASAADDRPPIARSGSAREGLPPQDPLREWSSAEGAVEGLR